MKTVPNCLPLEFQENAAFTLAVYINSSIGNALHFRLELRSNYILGMLFSGFLNPQNWKTREFQKSGFPDIL